MSYKERTQANKLQIPIMLLERRLEGNPLIAESELEELHPAAFGWAFSCCQGRQQDAEEVLQLVYMKLLDGSARYKGDASLKTWLFAVIRNTARAYARKKRTRLGILKIIGDQKAAEPLTAPAQEEAFIKSEEASLVIKAFTCLSKRQQEILELVFYRDLTIEEAARVINVSLGTARVHYERGKKALSSLLEKELKDDR